MPTLMLNDREVSFETGQTLLEVARENGVQIPTLCHLEGTTPTGACRICVVEVKGARGLVPSCATPAVDGMEVHTESPRVVEARRVLLNLMLGCGNHNCAVHCDPGAEWTARQMAAIENDGEDDLCPAWGDCRLQDLAFRYQAVGTPTQPSTFPPMEIANPLIVRDFSRCILCGRCVQACNEVQVNRAISFGYRGSGAKIIAAGDRPLVESDCVFCGECVQACPVGALIEKKSRYSWRPWEVRKVRTTCPYCGVGCQLILEVRDNQIVKIKGDPDGFLNRGYVCHKGRVSAAGRF